MLLQLFVLLPVLAQLALASPVLDSPAPNDSTFSGVSLEARWADKNIQVGARPYYLIRNMTDSPLKSKLESCREEPIRPSRFSISHRGAPLQFPEHSVEGIYMAARQGAGIIECDTSFTSDRQLVCRHSQCDLHFTTNILTIPDLAEKCTTPFQPAADGQPATAKCCTSDITAADFKRLCAKMEGANASATNPEDYLHGAPRWRTELYETCGTPVLHREYIDIVNSLGLDFTTEAKAPEVEMPFQGEYTQEDFLNQITGEFQQAGIDPKRVWLQSFVLDDVVHWVDKSPDFGAQAIYLDERTDSPGGYEKAVESMGWVAGQGVKIIAPSFPWLLTVDNSTNTLEPSTYALAAKEAGLKIVTWSLERSGPLAVAKRTKDSYYVGLWDWIQYDGQLYEVIDALAQKVKVIGAFSDWPATVTYYASCLGLKGGFDDEDRN